MSESTTVGAEPEQQPADTTPDAPEVPAATTVPATGVPPVPSTPPAGTDTTGPDAGAPKRMRLVRALGRWTAAVAVFGVLGSGIAYGITELDRTDVPGLATKSDGRWQYPELKLPALPSRSPRPFAEGNNGEIHHADVRDLLLPVPEGASADDGLPSIDGEWISTADFATAYVEADRTGIEQALLDDAVRHIAARGWVMPDGTRTSVYLLQFNSAAYPGDFLVDALEGGVTPYVSLVGSREDEIDESWPEKATVPNIGRHAYDEAKPRGEEHVRSAYLTAGDTLAVIVQARKGTAHAVPFQQTVILQSQLLG